MPMDYEGKGTPSATVMVAAKGRMGDLLKRMMQAKLKAKLGKALGMEGEEDCEVKPSGMEDGQEEEAKSGETELPDEDMRQLLELYSKLK